jgi:hypothetical protein
VFVVLAVEVFFVLGFAELVDVGWAGEFSDVTTDSDGLVSGVGVEPVGAMAASSCGGL